MDLILLILIISKFKYTISDTTLYLTRYITAIVMIMITLTLVSIHTITGRLYAIEQPSTMQGINEEECNKIFNCKIITENVFKYPERVNPFDKNEEFADTVMNNINDTEKIEGQSCQKLMDVDVESTTDQLIDKQTPKFLICLP